MYGGYGGAVSTYNPTAEAQGIQAERRVVRAEEKADMPPRTVQQLRAGIVAATADIRRKMTQKYKVEF